MCGLFSLQVLHCTHLHPIRLFTACVGLRLMSLQVLYPTLSNYDIRYYVMEILKVGHPDTSRLASFPISSRCLFESIRHYCM